MNPAHCTLQTSNPKPKAETRNPHPENQLTPNLKPQTPQHEPPNAGGMREAREAVGATRAVCARNHTLHPKPQNPFLEVKTPNLNP